MTVPLHPDMLGRFLVLLYKVDGISLAFLVQIFQLYLLFQHSPSPSPEIRLVSALNLPYHFIPHLPIVATYEIHVIYIPSLNPPLIRCNSYTKHHGSLQYLDEP